MCYVRREGLPCCSWGRDERKNGQDVLQCRAAEEAQQSAGTPDLPSAAAGARARTEEPLEVRDAVPFADARWCTQSFIGALSAQLKRLPTCARAHMQIRS